MGSITADSLNIQPVYFNNKDEVVNWYGGGSDTIFKRSLPPKEITPFEVRIHPLSYSEISYVSLYITSREYSIIKDKCLNVTLNIPKLD